ncbi:hypothetical protein, partial [Listeria monocytogenes]|uniref:hypothetical protein n=1 Tax=Listeria monocytogenes TaxID=1639 RepID=UPI003F66AF22
HRSEDRAVGFVEVDHVGGILVLTGGLWRIPPRIAKPRPKMATIPSSFSGNISSLEDGGGP